MDSSLAEECIKKNIDIFPVPGASSITAAMSVSGFEDKFLFIGFLPKTKNELVKFLSKFQDLDLAIIFFIPGVKINFYLENFKNFFLGRDILIAREITKIHETFYRGSIDTIKFFKTELKGELTVIISKKNLKNEPVVKSEIKNQAIKYLQKYSLKDVVELISKKENMSKKEVYQICLSIKNKK